MLLVVKAALYPSYTVYTILFFTYCLSVWALIFRFRTALNLLYAPLSDIHIKCYIISRKSDNEPIIWYFSQMFEILRSLAVRGKKTKTRRIVVGTHSKLQT